MASRDERVAPAGSPFSLVSVRLVRDAVTEPSGSAMFLDASLRRLALYVGLSFLLISCAADPGSGGVGFDVDRPPPGDTGPDVAPNDTGFELNNPDTETPIPGNPYLEFASDRNVRVPFASSKDLSIRYLDGQGTPIPNARVNFRYDEVRAQGSALVTQRATTDANGVGTVTLRAGTIPADFEVTASTDGEGVNSLTFLVTVTSKEASDYIFQVVYDGPLRLSKTDIYLFRSGGGCATLPRNPDEIVGAFDRLTVLPLADGSFDGYPYEATREDIPILSAVAISFLEDAPVGFACNDGPFENSIGLPVEPTEVELGDNVIVKLYVRELFPSIRGEYLIENQFDVIEFLPPAVQNVVRYIGQFFDSPGQTLFLILRDAGILDGLPFGLEGTLADVIDSLLFAFLPESVRNVFETGADIYGALQNMRFQGRMIIFEDADASGRLSDCNEIILDKVIINFASIEDGIFDLRARGYQAAYGTFTGGMEVVSGAGGVSYVLNIDPYSLSLNWGELTVFLLEQVVFPLLLGPSVDSMEAFVRSFLDCREIADEIGWRPIEGLCDAAVDAAVAGIIDFLSGQTVDTGDFYLLSTPIAGSTPPAGVELLEEGIDWAPCDLSINRSGGAFEVQRMGNEGRDRCAWDARFLNGAADPIGRPVSAAFFADRRSNRPSGVCDDGR